MKFLFLFLSLNLLACKREISPSKELVYFQIDVTGNPLVASIILARPAESDFFVIFQWSYSGMEPHTNTLVLTKGQTQAQISTGIDSTGYKMGIEMIDWTKETEHYVYALDRR